MDLTDLTKQIEAMDQLIAERAAELKAIKQAKRKLEAALEKLRQLPGSHVEG